MQAQSTNVIGTKAPSSMGNNAVRVNRVKPEPEVHRLHRVNLRSKIDDQGSRLIALDFEKLNGQMRTLVGRKGVTAHLKGGENKVVRDDRSYITLFDMQAKQYRTVNLATVTELRCEKTIFRVID